MNNKISNIQDILCFSTDPQAQHCLELAEKVAHHSATVLIHAEHGSEPHALAHFIHARSKWTSFPLQVIRCGSFDEAWAEQLRRNLNRYGQFEGTLLLDDIAELPQKTQIELAEWLQSLTADIRNGASSHLQNHRVIAITQKNLQNEVDEGRFRSDLFFSLNVFPISWPPLRERPNDIILLAEYFLNRHSRSLQRPAPALTPAAQRRLTEYSWPGNVRELESIIQRVLILRSKSVLDAEDFHLTPNTPLSSTKKPEEISVDPIFSSSLEHQEYNVIMRTLLETQGHRTRTAQLLQISPRTLRYKIARMKELGMIIPQSRWGVDNFSSDPEMLTMKECD